MAAHQRPAHRFAGGGGPYRFMRPGVKICRISLSSAAAMLSIAALASFSGIGLTGSRITYVTKKVVSVFVPFFVRFSGMTYSVTIIECFASTIF
jgi:hypothetical protein